MTNLTAEEVLDLLSICLKESSFKYRDRFNHMTSGLAMGSPVSPVVANIFMSQLEQSSIATLTTKPRLWLRFVDDILSIVRKDWVDKTLRHLNSQHENIVFTSEIEADGKLPYLDAKIERTG